MTDRIIARRNKRIPAKTERNLLVHKLRAEGFSYTAIANHPEVVRLSGNTILTKGRISQILLVRGGESK